MQTKKKLPKFREGVQAPLAPPSLNYKYVSVTMVRRVVNATYVHPLLWIRA